MGKVTMTATVPYKGREAGATFETSVKNARALEAAGTASAVKAKKAPAKKAAVKKAPAKKQAYKTRALKAAK